MLTIILDMLSLAWLVAQPLPPSPPTKAMPGEAVKIDREVVADALLNAAERPSEPRITRGRGNSITISGRLFYNDRRDDGLHGVRRDPAGKPTLECDPNGILVQRGPNGQCSINWAGAQYVVVDVIERDAIEPLPKPVGNPPNWSGCKFEDDLGSATINNKGEYSITISGRDTCGLERSQALSIQLRFRLRFCGSEWCFSVRRPNSNDDPAGDPYQLFHRDASAQQPLRLWAGDRVEMPDGFFKTSADGANPDFEAVAANIYASLVDTVLTVHRKHGIPFYKAEFGELEYVYPSENIRTTNIVTTVRGIKTGTATTASERLVIQRSMSLKRDPVPDQVDPVWISGSTPPHEYGHVMMLRAWGGDYGFDGYGKHGDMGPGAIDGRAEDPAPQIAFKEGWADFVRFIAYEAADNDSFCLSKNHEDNAQSPLGGNAQTGIQFLINNEKALCDWYDQKDDGQDLFEQHDFPAMWKTLRGMYINRERLPQAYPGLGRTICDFVIHYQMIGPQTGRKTNPLSASRQYIESGPLLQNGITCPLVRY